MEISNETKERIENAAAEKFPDGKNDSRLTKMLTMAEQNGYIAGATAEIERSNGLVEALKTIRKDVKDQPHLLDIIDISLNTYNNPGK